jgi:hypothetical protein
LRPYCSEILAFIIINFSIVRSLNIDFIITILIINGIILIRNLRINWFSRYWLIINNSWEDIWISIRLLYIWGSIICNRAIIECLMIQIILNHKLILIWVMNIRFIYWNGIKVYLSTVGPMSILYFIFIQSFIYLSLFLCGIFITKWSMDVFNRFETYFVVFCICRCLRKFLIIINYFLGFDVCM